MKTTYQTKPKLEIKVDLPKTIGIGYGAFWRSKNFYRVVKGSRGSKKSKTTALNFIVRLLKYPWANLLVIRRYSNTNKQSTYTDFKWACNQLKVTHLFKFNESLPEITVKATGQKILFRGLDDELKITSITVDAGALCWAWFEEAYQIETEDKFSTVVESIRGTLDVPDFFKQITVTFNPWSERHWLKRVFFDEETKRDDTFSDTTTFRVNEWLDEVDRKRYLDLYKTNPRRARIVCDGEWGVAEGLVFDNFEVIDFDIDKIVSKHDTSSGMDFGFTQDPTTLICVAVDLESKELWLYNEHYQKAMLTDDIVKMIRDKNMHKSYIAADSAEKRLIAEIRSKGISGIVPSLKGKGSIMQGIQFIQGFKIHIHPSCEHTIEEFNTYTFKQDKEGNWLNEPIDKNNHIVDAIRYALEKYHIARKQSTNTFNILRQGLKY
ncbi:TPA: PBSX family phage terminase large subunit [Streptococcus pyogenes]|uniref:PBSX family phage terminase large subunit n=1 Tax=Streptococcus TaxID=1301 RepID=UPI0007C8269D|nr:MULTISPECIES: PBSX family phage terminase large subunit [Streptococcus]HER4795285.1 PBSX family phage terminase large subunit [Streptococcus pyogenes NGAS104]HER5200474.1 PBSX family phage terminase large subunit [Streptococcus pyogenes MGAS15009]HER5282132.1 PBSX family phage terminase large subunit [Streptococcus pyogenes MGAS15061]OAF77645.1 terminase [Streptococcus pyogenes]OBZ05894.1 terminase [Streptococcus dysgalactiae subsp. equisimilis]